MADLFLKRREGGGPQGPTTSFYLEADGLRPNITSFYFEEVREGIYECRVSLPETSECNLMGANITSKVNEREALRFTYALARAQADQLANLIGARLVDETGLEQAAQSQPLCTDQGIRFAIMDGPNDPDPYLYRGSGMTGNQHL